MHFRVAFLYVRGHAIALFVSRRNEGDHRNLKLDMRGAYNIGGPLVMSRLRHGQTAELMAQSAFVSFAGKTWTRRGAGSAVNILLSHMFPVFRLNEMTLGTRNVCMCSVPLLPSCLLTHRRPVSSSVISSWPCRSQLSFYCHQSRRKW